MSQSANTSLLPTSTVVTSQLHHNMTSQLRNPYDYPSANSPMNHDIMPNMRLMRNYATNNSQKKALKF